MGVATCSQPSSVQTWAMGGPGLVGGRHVGLPVRQVGRDRLAVVAVGRAQEPLGVSHLQAQPGHRFADFVAARPDAGLFQFVRDPPGAVGLLGLLEEPPEPQVERLGFLGLPGRLRLLGPGMVGAGADLHGGAQRGDGIGLLLLPDEAASHPGSLAKKAAAFF